jgi:hypothetical protein
MTFSNKIFKLGGKRWTNLNNSHLAMQNSLKIQNRDAR